MPGNVVSTRIITVGPPGHRCPEPATQCSLSSCRTRPHSAWGHRELTPGLNVYLLTPGSRGGSANRLVPSPSPFPFLRTDPQPLREHGMKGETAACFLLHRVRRSGQRSLSTGQLGISGELASPDETPAPFACHVPPLPSGTGAGAGDKHPFCGQEAARRLKGPRQGGRWRPRDGTWDVHATVGVLHGGQCEATPGAVRPLGLRV